QLGESALEVGEVADAEPDRGRIERAVVERERERVALDPLDLARLPARPGEHALREVQAGDLAAGANGGQREVARPAAGVEHPVARPDDGSRGLGPPAPVEPG